MAFRDWFRDIVVNPIPPLPSKPRVIVLERGRLTDEEIQKALAGNAGALWYQALVSKIESLREDNLMEASRSASAGNELAMAGGLNTYEALTGLLAELDQCVNATKD